MNKLAYSVDEVADLLSIGRTKAFELVRTGQLSSIKLGHRRLVTQLDLDDFIGQVRSGDRSI